MIWNTPKMSPSHLSPATAIFVVDCCQFGPSWIFGLKIELMACAGLVGGTTEQGYLFPELICYYKWYEILLIFFELQLSPATAIFVVYWCLFGPSCIFGQKMELMACAVLVGGTTEQGCLFRNLYVIINDMKNFWYFCITTQPCRTY